MKHWGWRVGAFCALALAVLPADAGAAARPRLKVTGSAPLALSSGAAVNVVATVRSAKKAKIKIGLVFATAANGKGGVLLGSPKVVKLRARKTARIKVAGRVPASLAAGRVGRVLVCLDPAKAVKGKAPASACRALGGRVAVAAGTDAGAIIAAAVRAGRITRTTALGYSFLAGVGDVGALPAELRGARYLGDTHEAAVQIASNPKLLTGSLAAQVLPYFAPPSASKAWFAGQPPARSRHSAALPTSPDCSGFSTLQEPPTDSLYKRTWQSIVTAGGKARIWYLHYAPIDPASATLGAQHNAQALAQAQAYATAMTKIWNTLTAEFGEPQSDGGEACYHGPDGLFDVYIQDDVGGAFRSVHALGATMPYPAVGNFPAAGQFCTDRPAFIVIYAGLDPFVLAHEFMHAIQFSHRRLSCAEPAAFLDEGEADWAGDQVYPDSQYELNNHGSLLRNPTSSSDVATTTYAYWPMWMMQFHTTGLSTLTAIFDQLTTKPTVEAVNAALPGGFAKQLPLLALTVWNQEPIGSSGWQITDGFRTWENWTGTPNTGPETKIQLGAGTLKTFSLHHPAASLPALSIGAYDSVSVTDPKVKYLEFTNDLVGQPVHVDAMVQLADDSWHLQDWTAKDKIDFCRDKADENVKRVVIVSTNISLHTNLPGFSHSVEALNSCPFPHQFTGTFTSIWTDPGFYTFEFTGTVTMVRSANNPPQDVGVIYYDLTSGSVTLAASGSNLAGCTASGGTTVPITPTLPYIPDQLTLEDVAGNPQAPDPEPNPYYYSAAFYEYDPAKSPTYTVTCNGNAQTVSSDRGYLQIGFRDWWQPNPPEILKSATPGLLAGHRIRDGGSGISIDETWSFQGTG